MANLQQSSCNCKKSNHKSSSGLKTDNALDTLVQIDKVEFNTSTSLTDKRRLLSRARRKYLSSNLSLQFIDYIRNPINPIPFEAHRERLIKSTWNWYHCASALVLEGKKITTKYCNSRMCFVCNSIRQAKYIRKFQPIIDEWKNGQFLTLTLPNVPADELRNTIRYMNHTFSRIKQMLYKRSKVGKGDKLIGIKKLEVTFNDKFNSYHPHFHFILNSKSNAIDVLNEWLKRTKHLGTKRIAQDVRPLTKNTSIELFKYHTKLVVSKSKMSKSSIYHNLVQLNALKHVRTVSHFGFDVEEVEAIEDLGVSGVDEDVYEDGNVPLYDVYQWNDIDWYSITTGMPLTKHIPSMKSTEFLEEFENSG